MRAYNYSLAPCPLPLNQERREAFLLPAFPLSHYDLVLEEILDGFVGNHLFVEGIGTRLWVLHHLDDLGVGTAVGLARLEGSRGHGLPGGNSDAAVCTRPT